MTHYDESEVTSVQSRELSLLSQLFISMLHYRSHSSATSSCSILFCRLGLSRHWTNEVKWFLHQSRCRYWISCYRKLVAATCEIWSRPKRSGLLCSCLTTFLSFLQASSEHSVCSALPRTEADTVRRALEKKFRRDLDAECLSKVLVAF